MELRDEEEKKLWSMPASEEEKIEFILQYRRDKEEDEKRSHKREEDARKLGLIP